MGSHPTVEGIEGWNALGCATVAVAMLAKLWRVCGELVCETAALDTRLKCGCVDRGACGGAMSVYMCHETNKKNVVACGMVLCLHARYPGGTTSVTATAAYHQPSGLDTKHTRQQQPRHHKTCWASHALVPTDTDSTRTQTHAQ